MFPQSDGIITTPEQYEQDVATIMRDWPTHGAFWLMENPKVLEEYTLIFIDAIKRCTASAQHQAMLGEFALCSYSELRDAVACNENTSVTLLGLLSTDQSWDVRMSVASNRKTPACILEQMSEDKSAEVIKKVVDHPNVSLNTLRKLGAHFKPFISKRATLKYLHIEMLQRAGVP